MDRETLLDAVRAGPVEVTMNDGQTFEIPGIEFCIVDDIAAYVLTRREDGSWKAKILALVCMTAITPLTSQAG